MKKIIYPLLIVFSTFSIATAQTDEVTRLIKEGIALHDKGNYKEAIEKYTQAVALDPNSGVANYEIAYSYQMMNDFANAIKYADIAISKGGGTELSGYIIKGSAMDDMGDTKGAIKVYEKALKRFPDNYLLFFNYGISNSRIGKIDEAEEAYIKAILLKPTHPGSNLVLAHLNLDRGNKTKGILGLYFFLMLENNTERAKTAFDRLQEVLYNGIAVEEDGKNTTITLNSDGEIGEMASQISLNMRLMESIKANKDKNKFERLAIDTDTFFEVTSEFDENKKKKKKKGELDVWSDIYLPIFYGIHEKKHAEAFTYHISKASQDQLVTTWIESNQFKMDAFYDWLQKN